MSRSSARRDRAAGEGRTAASRLKQPASVNFGLAGLTSLRHLMRVVTFAGITAARRAVIASVRSGAATASLPAALTAANRLTQETPAGRGTGRRPGRQPGAPACPSLSVKQQQDRNYHNHIRRHLPITLN